MSNSAIFKNKPLFRTVKNHKNNVGNKAKKIGMPMVTTLSFVTNASLALGAGILAISLATSHQQDHVLTPDEPGKMPPATEPTNSSFTHYVATQTDPLTVRNLPNTQANAINKLPKGECVRVIGSLRQGWATIDLPNTRHDGHVADRFLNPVTPQTRCPN